MDLGVARLECQELSTDRLSGALGIPVIDGEVTHHSGTIIQVRIDQFAKYKSLMTEGSLAIVDRQAEAVMIRLGETETWLFASADYSTAEARPSDSSLGLLEYTDIVIDSVRANRVASRVAQSSGFAAVARKPHFREDFARPIVLEWYDEEASEWHVGEIATRARNLWEYGVLPRDAKAMRAEGKDLASIATALGVPKNRAKWAMELPNEHSMIKYL